MHETRLIIEFHFSNKNIFFELQNQREKKRLLSIKFLSPQPEVGKCNKDQSTVMNASGIIWNHDQDHSLNREELEGGRVGGRGTCRNNFPTSAKKVSNPSILQVSENPLSPLQRGHFLSTPASPRYHLSTQAWQPMIFLQHLAKIAGGWIGLAMQMWHVNVS